MAEKKIRKVTVKKAEPQKKTIEKIISYGPLLPCLAVAVLVLSGLSGYEEPAAAVGTGANPPGTTQTAESATGTGATTGTTVQRATIAARSTANAPAAAAAASGARKSLAKVQDAAAYKDGTYTGTATGFVGPITVKVTVSGGKISDIQITSSSDNEPYLSNAKGVIRKIINGQTTNVDVVSGATYSSNGIIGAVRNALSKAATSASAKKALASSGGNSGSSANGTLKAGPTTTRKPVTTGKAGQFPYPDGTYEGEGEGRNDTIRLAVTLKNGSITDIQVLEHYEDEVPYFNNAKTLLQDVLKAQTLKVDTVSGATLSSNGLLEALEDALGHAKEAASGSTPATPAAPVTAAPTTAAPSSEPTTAPTPTTAAPATTDNSATTANSAATDSSTTTTMVPDATSSAQPASLTNAPAEDPNEGTTYKNGDYFVSVTVYPDADEDFDSYQLTAKVVIQKDQVVSITGVSGDGDSSNKSYINKAANGTSKKKGVIEQITSKGNTSGIDAVSGATCTSDALVQAVDQALAQARSLR